MAVGWVDEREHSRVYSIDQRAGSIRLRLRFDSDWRHDVTVIPD
jgi:hypothetical protein